jgi:hypothetical protein
MEIVGSFSAVMAQQPPTNALSHGTAALEYMIEGTTHKPFTQFGAIASLAPRDYSHASLEIAAANPDGTLHWKLRFQIDRYLTTPGRLEVAPISLWANLVQHRAGSPKAQSRGLRGTLELDQASHKLGSTISGKFTLRARAFEEEKKP